MIPGFDTPKTFFNTNSTSTTNNSTTNSNFTNNNDNNDNTVTIKVNKVYFGKKKVTNNEVSKSNNNSNSNSNSNSNEEINNSFKIYHDEEDLKNRKLDDYGMDIPDIIQGSYKYDYNILDIHNLLIRKFQVQKDRKLYKLEKKLVKQQKKIKGRQNVIDRKISRKKISILENEIENVENDQDFKEYITASKPIVEQYRKIGPLSKIVSFVKDSKNVAEETVENKEQQMNRYSIIFDYLEVARKYININIYREVVASTCSGCGLAWSDETCQTYDQGIVVCNCGYERYSVFISPFCKDMTRVNTTRNNYDDKENFRKVVNRFQGKEANPPGLELYDRLDDYFRRIGFPTSDIIKEYPLNKEGRKKGTNKSLIYEALKEINYTDQYDHVNLICHIYWGWKLHDLSHLEDQIMADYETSQNMVVNLTKDRKSSLNSQFRLYKHLKRLDYDCKEDDFKIPTTPDIREYHEIVWDKLCKLLDWENK